MSFFIKRHDRSPALQATLSVDGEALNLTGTTVKFIMSAPGATQAKVSAAAAIVSASGGIVSYSWAAGDTDTAGLYMAEFEVDFGSGIKRTFPSDDFFYVHVVADLG